MLLFATLTAKYHSILLLVVGQHPVSSTPQKDWFGNVGIMS